MNWKPNQNITSVREVRQVYLDDLGIHLDAGWWVLNFMPSGPNEPCSCKDPAHHKPVMPSPVFVIGRR